LSKKRAKTNWLYNRIMSFVWVSSVVVLAAGIYITFKQGKFKYPVGTCLRHSRSPGILIEVIGHDLTHYEIRYFDPLEGGKMETVLTQSKLEGSFFKDLCPNIKDKLPPI